MVGHRTVSDDRITIVEGPDAAVQYDRRVKINAGNRMTGDIIETRPNVGLG